MKYILSCWLALALFFLSVESADALFIDQLVTQWRQLRAEHYDFELAKMPLFNSKYLTPPAVDASTAEGTYLQKLSHFDVSETRVFPQRYWVDSSHASGPDAPVLYYICGEARCSPGGGFTTSLAKELRAYTITLEHRYYGDSIPVATYSAGDLKYLSTDEALADLAAFQAYIGNEMKLTGAWIGIGGSYAGSLSAYYRLKYPTNVVGALSSSAPVQAKAEFEEYDHQVATIVPPACLTMIQKVASEVETDLKSPDGRVRVKALFGSSEVKDDIDFLYIVADMAAIAIQYGSRDTFCAEIQNASDAKAAYAEIGLKLFEDFGITTLEDTAQGNMSEDPNNYRKNGMRQWIYQSCTEFGYWQVAHHDPKKSARSARIDLPFHNEICNRLFGIKGTVNTNPINRTYYRPIVDGEISKVFFTNGTDDPWQHLAINPIRGNVPNTAEAMLIDGAAHCDDLGETISTNVAKAQDRFRELSKKWFMVKTSSSWPDQDQFQ